ncbi:MAG: DUF4199 domain-containing protein [Flavisolibacter sp.]|jgi:hypothetical protein|nr:DUF4199 domain-containing protein [Flavisolibacter sp.]
MKKIVWVFGMVIGALLSINMVIMVNLFYNNPDIKGTEFIGYAATVILFSLIFFGVRNYRNKQNGGIISFGKAFKAGLLIALIGSTMYVITWLFYYYLFVPDFFDKYISYILKETPATELAAKTKEMEGYKKMYENPLFVVLITYSEVLPVGIIVSLISALILKRKTKNQPIQDR